MQFLTFLAAIVATSTSIAAVAAVTVGYTNDLNPPRYLSSLSCGTFFTNNYPQYSTLGDLPTASSFGWGEFPGASDDAPQAQCGSCWQLTYTPNGQSPVTEYIIAVDDASNIQLTQQAFNALAGPDAYKGSVDATAVQVPIGNCGLPSQ